MKLVTNGSFEEAGDYPWHANNWAESRAGTLFDYYELTPEYDPNWGGNSESFELGWGVYTSEFGGLLVDLTPTYFDTAQYPKDVEDFEDLWGETPAIVQSLNAGPWSLSAEVDVFTFTVGGTPYAVTVHAADFLTTASAKPGELAAVINRDVVGVGAYVVGGQYLRVETQDTGASATLQVSISGATAPNVGFPTTLKTGGPFGSPFIRTSEFGFLGFASADLFEAFDVYDGGYEDLDVDFTGTSARLTYGTDDPFDSGWGTVSLTADPSDEPSSFTEYTTEPFDGSFTAMTTVT